MTSSEARSKFWQTTDKVRLHFYFSSLYCLFCLIYTNWTVVQAESPISFRLTTDHVIGSFWVWNGSVHRQNSTLLSPGQLPGFVQTQSTGLILWVNIPHIHALKAGFAITGFGRLHTHRPIVWTIVIFIIITRTIIIRTKFAVYNFRPPFARGRYEDCTKLLFCQSKAFRKFLFEYLPCEISCECSVHVLFHEASQLFVRHCRGHVKVKDVVNWFL